MTSTYIETALTDKAGALVHLGNTTIEVSVEIANDLAEAIGNVVKSGQSFSYTITGDHADVVFLVGPSTPIVVEFASGCAPEPQIDASSGD